MSESIDALRRANPRFAPGFGDSVDTAASAVRARISVAEPEHPSRERLLGASVAGTALAAAAAVALFVTLGPSGSRRGIADAAAAVEKAATVSAASAERSGTATVRITHGGEPWAGSTIRWHGDDLAVSRDAPQRRGKAGSALLVVDGSLYGIDPRDGGWVNEGTPSHIDPGSGTTPAEYLAAVREDVGGVTLERITRGMTGLTTRQLADGGTVYSGAVAAALVARETGFKEGQAIRVLPFGYVAHDEAADPVAALHAEVTVAADGVVRAIQVTWGTWSYRVAYEGLGTTPGLVAPANAKSLLEERLRRASAG